MAFQQLEGVKNGTYLALLLLYCAPSLRSRFFLPVRSLKSMSDPECDDERFPILQRSILSRCEFFLSGNLFESFDLLWSRQTENLGRCPIFAVNRDTTYLKKNFCDVSSDDDSGDPRDRSSLFEIESSLSDPRIQN